MNELLLPLMQEYQRLMEIENKFEEWKKKNPELGSWKYEGQRVSKARFERIGVIIRQTMIDFERNHKGY